MSFASTAKEHLECPVTEVIIELYQLVAPRLLVTMVLIDKMELACPALEPKSQMACSTYNSLVGIHSHMHTLLQAHAMAVDVMRREAMK